VYIFIYIRKLHLFHLKYGGVCKCVYAYIYIYIHIYAQTVCVCVCLYMYTHIYTQTPFAPLRERALPASGKKNLTIADVHIIFPWKKDGVFSRQRSEDLKNKRLTRQKGRVLDSLFRFGLP